MHGLDQYGAGPFEQQQFGTAGVEGVKLKPIHNISSLFVQQFSIQWSSCTCAVQPWNKTGRNYSVMKRDIVPQLLPVAAPRIFISEDRHKAQLSKGSGGWNFPIGSRAKSR